MKNIAKDIIAGFSVFLLALPLCLGIAIASNFPSAAGILTAIVGGLVTSWFSGAPLSIKGPAAGLIVIVLSSVQDLGGGDLQLGYERTLAVGVAAALIQIVIGLARKAIYVEIIPPSIIHGMLAAIGVIIISKQSYVMMGVTPEASPPLQLLLGVPKAIFAANPVLLGIGILSLGVAIAWPKIKSISFIPSSIIIISIVIPLSYILDFKDSHFYTWMNKTYLLGPQFLIHLPENLSQAITFPDFSILFSPLSLKYIITLALVGSIESLLTVCAIDTMTTRNESSNLNKDLWALGVGNLLSSLIGGLPMISEIVRSKANIDYGAQSSISNFFHSLFMLLSIVLIPQLINTIPLSALAALLVFVGWRLSSPKEFKHVYRLGKEEFSLFLCTLLATLMTDLLIGVVVGLALKFALLLFKGYSPLELFQPTINVIKNEKEIIIEIEGPFTFAGYLKFKSLITELSKDSTHIVIDLDSVTYLDHAVLAKLNLLAKEFPNTKLIIEENQQLVTFYNTPNLQDKQ